MNENEIRYKECLIRDRSYELKDGGWIAQADIFEPTENGVVEQHPPLLSPNGVTFPTREEAREYSFGMGKDFVDQR